MVTNIVDCDFDTLKCEQAVKLVFKPTDGGPAACRCSRPPKGHGSSAVPSRGDAGEACWRPCRRKPRQRCRSTRPAPRNARCAASRSIAIPRAPMSGARRRAPNAPVIGHLVPMIRVDKDEYSGVEFDIVGFRDGWFLIRNGSDDGLKLDAGARRTTGRGWVSVRLVGVQLRVPALRSAPRREARARVAQLRGENWGPDSVTVSAVHACHGPYMEVTTTPYGGTMGGARLVLQAVLQSADDLRWRCDRVSREKIEC